MSVLTQERLKELLHYDPDTGKFVRLTNKSPRALKGKAIGWRMGDYLGVLIDYKRYYLHRLAWFYMTGRWPLAEIDHINRNKHDNRWDNLREATRSQNEANKSIFSNNTSGARGVYVETRTKVPTYRAQIKINQKTKVIGTYKSLEEARNAYNAAFNEYFGDFMQTQGVQ